jgi:hypothetical protein
MTTGIFDNLKYMPKAPMRAAVPDAQAQAHGGRSCPLWRSASPRRTE